MDELVGVFAAFFIFFEPVLGWSAKGCGGDGVEDAVDNGRCGVF
jgi:hypothetical protein